MSKLFLYYSHTGSGDFIAEVMKEKGYEIYKVTPKHNLPKSFFWKMMIGGMLAGFRHKSKLKNYNVDLSSYDEIVLGTPIWNGMPACPINTVLKKTDFKDKNVKVIMYSGSGFTPKTKDKLQSLFNCDVVEIKEPKKYKDEAVKALAVF